MNLRVMGDVCGHGSRRLGRGVDDCFIIDSADMKQANDDNELGKRLE